MATGDDDNDDNDSDGAAGDKVDDDGDDDDYGDFFLLNVRTRGTEYIVRVPPPAPQRSSAAFLAGKKTSPFFFGRNIARVKIVP